MTYELSRYVNFFNFFKIMLDKLLFYVYYITCVRVNLFSHFHFNTYARVAQWWSTSLPRRGSRVRSPSRALLDKKRTFPIGKSFFLSKKCDALLELILLRSMGSISQSAEALFGRANAEVHRTYWLLNALKRLSVVPMQRSTGPCGFSER